jgi:nucleoside-diphosphate-sugar epimerase
MAAFAHSGGSVVTLRPGCVWGAGSELWVGRIARFLRASRLGDLGAAGDGWSNLVHVDDVCAAVVAALRVEPVRGEVRTYNLAAPDSPRWNEYFVDLSLAIGATPVRRISPTQLRMDAYLAGPPLKVVQTLLARARLSAQAVPDPLPPGLLGLWERHLHLDSQLAQRELRLSWTPYAEALKDSAAWFLHLEGRGARAPVAMQGSNMQRDPSPAGDPTGVCDHAPSPGPMR